MIEKIKTAAGIADSEVPSGKVLIVPALLNGILVQLAKDSDGNVKQIGGGATSEINFDNQPTQDANGNICYRLDDEVTQLNLIGWFDVAAASKLRFRVKSADTAESGDVALKVVVNGTAQSEQVFAIAAAGAWTDIELDFAEAADNVQIGILRDTASANDTLAASLLFQFPGSLVL